MTYDESPLLHIRWLCGFQFWVHQTWSKHHESQAADKFALDIMKKAKISLNGLKSLLSRLSEEEMLNQSLRSDFYRSHPVSKLRLRQLLDLNYIQMVTLLELH